MGSNRVKGTPDQKTILEISLCVIVFSVCFVFYKGRVFEHVRGLIEFWSESKQHTHMLPLPALLDYIGMPFYVGERRKEEGERGREGGGGQWEGMREGRREEGREGRREGGKEGGTEGGREGGRGGGRGWRVCIYPILIKVA